MPGPANCRSRYARRPAPASPDCSGAARSSSSRWGCRLHVELRLVVAARQDPFARLVPSRPALPMAVDAEPQASGATRAWHRPSPSSCPSETRCRWESLRPGVASRPSRSTTRVDGPIRDAISASPPGRQNAALPDRQRPRRRPSFAAAPDRAVSQNEIGHRQGRAPLERILCKHLTSSDVHPNPVTRLRPRRSSPIGCDFPPASPMFRWHREARSAAGYSCRDAL